MSKAQNFSGPLPQEPPTRLHHEPTAELTATPDPQLICNICSSSFIYFFGKFALKAV